MNARHLTLLVAALSVVGGVVYLAGADSAPGKTAVGAAKPSLSVVAVTPQWQELPHRLQANGSVAAWQEASIGAETGGLRLALIHVEVGDTVKRGQVLAVLAGETPQAELAQARAAVAEAEAAASEARANADRARSVQAAGALSAQQVGQYLAAEASALARVQSAQANRALAELRLKHTQVVASDDGVISQRQATLGAVVGQGQELFRLIRRNRLEWRAEVIASELAQIHAGQGVEVVAASGAQLQGRVRQVAPTVDAQTRNALVYVDLPAAAAGTFKPGMFAHGEFTLGKRKVLTVPRQALVVRDGFNYVFAIEADQHVRQVKVEVGQSGRDVVEILAGIDEKARLVGSGAGFLNDGDLVNVTGAPAAVAKKTS
jgi:RND family efflux transporter MFP subunit